MADKVKLIPFRKTRRLIDLPMSYVRFCEQVFEDGNGTQAYLDHIAKSPDTTHKTASVAAARILRQRKVRKYLRDLQRHAFSASRVTATKLVSLLASAAFADRAQLVNKDGSVRKPQKLPWDIRSTLEGMEVEETYGTVMDVESGKRITVVKSRKFKLKTTGRIAAAELLLRIKSMVGDAKDSDKEGRSPLSAPRSGPVVILPAKRPIEGGVPALSGPGVVTGDGDGI